METTRYLCGHAYQRDCLAGKPPTTQEIQASCCPNCQRIEVNATPSSLVRGYVEDGHFVESFHHTTSILQDGRVRAIVGQERTPDELIEALTIPKEYYPWSIAVKGGLLHAPTYRVVYQAHQPK
jgi:hypothetical protein